MTKKYSRSIALALSVFMLLTGVLPAFAAEIDQETEAAIRAIVENEYYLTLEELDLAQDDLEDILGALDKHSAYLTREEYQTFDSSVEGTFGGLGVSVATTDDGVAVTGVIPETPAERAGMKIGDIFVSVDGQDVSDLLQKDLVPVLRGEVGSSVVVEMERANEDQPLIFVLTRAIIDISGKIAELSEEGVAYFKVNTFGSDVGSWFMKHLIEMRESEQGLNGIVLDVRDNAGGRLSAALSMASAILDKETHMTKIYNQDQLIHNYRSTTPGVDVPVVILGNANSASASELVIVALTDNDRAVLVGENTYGKGVIQTIFNLPNNDVVKLTTSEYKGPRDTPIQGVGLVPDYVVVDIPEEAGEEVVDEQLIFAMDLIREEIKYYLPSELTFILNEPEAFLGLRGVVLSTENRMHQGSFVVPLRESCELLNLKVRFENGKVIVNGQDNELVFTPGDTSAWTNGREIELPQPLLIQNGRTYLPVRFLGEQLDYHVYYDATTQEVILSR
jgi:carboxyl-terminal processing protease